MNQVTTQTHGQTTILSEIREGMTVYDKENHKVGSVETVYFGANADASTPAAADAPATTTPRTTPAAEESFIADLAKVFDPKDQIPDELASRLRHHGFIQIDGGWFGSDRYVMPEQINSVSDDNVYLNTKRETLIKE